MFLFQRSLFQEYEIIDLNKDTSMGHYKLLQADRVVGALEYLRL